MLLHSTPLNDSTSRNNAGGRFYPSAAQRYLCCPSSRTSQIWEQKEETDSNRVGGAALLFDGILNWPRQGGWRGEQTLLTEGKLDSTAVGIWDRKRKWINLPQGVIPNCAGRG